MLGTVGAFAALGAVSGFVGQVAGASLGLYWKLFAGFISVLFGLATLSLLPFDLAKLGFTGTTWKMQSSGATIYGLAVGGGAATCSMFCNPVLPVALAVTTLQGHTLWGAAILAVFSIGYSLPMAGILVGMGLGFRRLTSVFHKINPIIQKPLGFSLSSSAFICWRHRNEHVSRGRRSKMKELEASEITESVRKRYGEIAKRGKSGCGCAPREVVVDHRVSL